MKFSPESNLDIGEVETTGRQRSPERFTHVELFYTDLQDFTSDVV